MAANQ